MIRKTGKVIVPTEPVSRATTLTGFTFKSYDKNGSVLEFQIKNQDGSPTDLFDATIRLLMYTYQGKEEKPFPILDSQVVTESYLRGVVKYPIPDILLNYEGKVDANIYIDFPDGSHTDNLYFTFNVKKSKIDEEAVRNGEYYFKDFEQLLKSIENKTEETLDGLVDNATEVTKKFDALNEKLTSINFDSLQKLKLTSDDGKALRLADLNPRPSTIDDLTRPGYYYITSAESNTFIPTDHYIRQNGMAGSGWITVYPGDAGGGVVQEWYRNTASAVANTRHLYRKQESVSPVTWNPWSEYAQTNSTMLSSSYYQGAAHKLAEATKTGTQATSYLELSENTGVYYLTTVESKAMTDFSSLPPEFIYGVFVENIPNSTINNFLQRITSNVTDGGSQPPVTYWRVIQKKADGYTPTKWRKVVSQDDAQMYKTTKDNGDSWRLEDLPAKPDGLEQWARLYKGWYYIPNSSLKTMSDYSTLPPEFANSHVHMEIQGGAGSVYARQTLTMYQAPFTQIYRVVTNTLAQPWQTVAMSSDLDAERQRMVDKTHGSLEWIAHRGNNTNFPENSTVAFENVKRHWGIETDIHLTSDGKWVVMHDETVDRTTNGTGKITEMTYTQFRALRIDTGPNLNALSDVEKRPPDLDEYLAICKNNNKIPVLELKASSNYTLDELKKIKSLADDFGITNKIVFISFSYDVLLNLRKIFPHNMLQFLFNGTINTTDMINKALALRLPSAVSVNYNNAGLNWSFVSKVHQLGVKVAVWTVPDASFQAMKNLKVDYITTDSLSGNLRYEKLTLQNGFVENLDGDRIKESFVEELGRGAIHLSFNVYEGVSEQNKAIAKLPSWAVPMYRQYNNCAIRNASGVQFGTFDLSGRLVPASGEVGTLSIGLNWSGRTAWAAGSCVYKVD